MIRAVALRKKNEEKHVDSEYLESSYGQYSQAAADSKGIPITGMTVSVTSKLIQSSGSVENVNLNYSQGPKTMITSFDMVSGQK